MSPASETRAALMAQATALYGGVRAAELATAIDRLTAAIDTVMTWPSREGAEPFPTGPRQEAGDR